jgi:tRNA threonylcarbamoyladenosine modification (KEOPS) complex Cgi121 subunit
MNATTTCGAAVVLAVTAAAAGSQVTKTVPGEVRVVTATVEAIERASREVTVKKADGQYEVIYVPTAIKRFDTLKIGDKISGRYYETVVLRMKVPGEKDADTAATSGIVRTEDRASGTASHQQTLTATITAIDPNVPSITFTGPQGWTYSSRVEDKKALAKVKVGDRVDITWTAAVILSLDDAK